MTRPQAPHPSPFYALLDGAIDVRLSFPTDEEGMGPYWDRRGDVDYARARGWETEEVALVRLGGDRYRLAEKLAGPFSGLRLQWGDEFVAVGAHGPGGGADPAGPRDVVPDPSQGEADLRVLHVVMPRPFKHYGWLLRRLSGNDDPLAGLVHRHGGGWENCAQGLTLLSVPADAARRFEDEVLGALGIRLSSEPEPT